MSGFPSLELFYFDIPGKGEAIRLACAYANLPLKDTRFASRDEFIAMKEAGKLQYGQVPMLCVDNSTCLVQTAAIMRYIGKLSGLYPQDALLAAKVDAVVDQEMDMFTGVAASTYRERFGFESLTDEQRDVVRKSLNDNVLPRHLSFLDKLLEESSSGWLAGTDRPSIADFIFAPRLKWLIAGVLEGISTHLFEPFPRVVAFLERFYALPEIVAYYQGK